MTASLLALRDFDTSLARELLSAGAVRLGPHGKRKMDEDVGKIQIDFDRFCRIAKSLVSTFEKNDTRVLFELAGFPLRRCLWGEERAETITIGSDSLDYLDEATIIATIRAAIDKIYAQVSTVTKCKLLCLRARCIR